MLWPGHKLHYSKILYPCLSYEFTVFITLVFSLVSMVNNDFI